MDVPSGTQTEMPARESSAESKAAPKKVLSLGELEQVVEEAQQAVFKKIGLVLEEIRERELYKSKGCHCMKEYVEKYQSFGWRQARRYMNAYQVVSKLAKRHDVLPTFETQVRCLATCSDEEIHLIWERAVEKARSTGVVIDRPLVENLKREVRQQRNGSAVSLRSACQKRKAPMPKSSGSDASSVEVSGGPQGPISDFVGWLVPGAACAFTSSEALLSENVKPSRGGTTVPLFRDGPPAARWSLEPGGGGGGGGMAGKPGFRPVNHLPASPNEADRSSSVSVATLENFGRLLGKRAKLREEPVNGARDLLTGEPRTMGGGPRSQHSLRDWVLARELSAAEVLADMVRK